MRALAIIAVAWWPITLVLLALSCGRGPGPTCPVAPVSSTATPSRQTCPNPPRLTLAPPPAPVLLGDVAIDRARRLDHCADLEVWVQLYAGPICGAVRW